MSLSLNRETLSNLFDNLVRNTLCVVYTVVPDAARVELPDGRVQFVDQVPNAKPEL